MMKAGYRALGIITTVWTVIVIILAVLIILPVVPRAVDIQPPPPDSWSSTITNDTVILRNNLTARDNNLFPIEVSLVIELFNDNGSTLAKFTTNKTTIQPGGTAQIPVTLEVNRASMDSAKLRSVIFNGTSFRALLYFNAKSLLNFQVSAGINANISIGPLVNRAEYGLNRSVLERVDNNFILSIPYSLNSSSILSDRNITINGTVSNDTQVLGTINETIALGQDVQGSFDFNLTSEAYTHLSTSPDHLILNLTVSISDLTWNYQVERDWQPPSSG
jgi:hypothetical protein